MRFRNLGGQRFGELVPLEIDHFDRNRNAIWKCRCSCGNYRLVSRQMLCRGTVKSCGCLNYKNVGTHGSSGDSLYNIWKQIKQRCYNPNNPNYQYYGGRGIVMDVSWFDEFMCFQNWANSHGYKQGLTIDRIDVNGDYCPDNCRWITKKEQCLNRRSNRLIVFNGKEQTLSQWSEETGINLRTLKSRLDSYGWSIERALTTPPKFCKGG